MYCRQVGVKPGRIYGNLGGTIRDAAVLTKHNNKNWLFVVYPFITKEDKQKTILQTIARLPKDEWRIFRDVYGLDAAPRRGTTGKGLTYRQLTTVRV